MATDTEVVTDGTIPREEGIDPFDWEDHLYESWLEEQWRQKRKRPADAGA
jgi:hypothetical protein